MRLTLALLAIASNIFAEHICHVEKSRLIWDSDNRQMRIELAKTPSFPVVADEHQDAFTLAFSREDGSAWGQVAVSTATHTTDQREEILCNATVSDGNSKIVAFLTLRPIHRPNTQML